MPYAILRFQKKKMGAVNASYAHNERTKAAYKSNPDIDKSRKNENYHLIETTNTYRKRIEHLILKNECKTRKDSVYLVETLITASPEFMKALPAEEQREFFLRALTFMKEQVGKENIISAMVHMDETTPHMHLSFCPITSAKKLSAKEILGNQAKLSDWQTKYHDFMNARWTELERGLSSMVTGRKHIKLWMYKMAERLDKQYADVSAALSNISVFNAGKKRDDALEILQKWVPQAEKFTAQIKTVDNYIKNLEHSVELKAQTTDYWKDETEHVKDKLFEANEKIYSLKNELSRANSLFKKIPPEILEEITRNKKTRDMER